MTDADKDKVLKTLWNYADKTALEENSGGRYVEEDSTIGKIRQAQEEGISPDTYVLFDVTVSGLTSDKDENGKTIKGSKQKKVIEAIDRMPITNEQKSVLYKTKYDSDANNPWA